MIDEAELTIPAYDLHSLPRQTKIQRFRNLHSEGPAEAIRLQRKLAAREGTRLPCRAVILRRICEV